MMSLLRVLLVVITTVSHFVNASDLVSPETKKTYEKAFDGALANCENAKIVGKDMEMKVLISTYYPQGESQREKLDRKKFCRCQIDGRLKEFGKVGAGALAAFEPVPGIDPTLQLEKEKKIFADCFKKSL